MKWERESWICIGFGEIGKGKSYNTTTPAIMKPKISRNNLEKSKKKENSFPDTFRPSNDFVIIKW